VKTATATYFYEPANIQPNQSRVYSISVSEPGNISVTLPAELGLLQGNLTSINSLQANLSSNPCTKGSIPRVTVSINGVPLYQLRFVCIPDEDLFNFKAELGHGNFNYLSTNKVPSNTEIEVYALWRSWNIGSYLVPNERAKNISMTCNYEPHQLGLTNSENVIISDNNITADCVFEDVNPSWFRLCYLSQKINTTTGNTMQYSCNNMSQLYEHTRVFVPKTSAALEARSTIPLALSVTDSGNGIITSTAKNTEKYELRDLNFVFDVGGYKEQRQLASLKPNESARYEVFAEGTGTFTTNVIFKPEWEFNSRSPEPFSQQQSSLYVYNNQTPRITYIEFFFDDKYYTDWNETFNMILSLVNQTLFVANNLSMNMNDTALILAVKNDTTNILNHWGSVYAIDIKNALDNILLEVRPIRQLASNPPLSSETKVALNGITSYAVSNLEAQKQAIVVAKQTQQQYLWIVFIIAGVGALFVINYLLRDKKKSQENA